MRMGRIEGFARRERRRGLGVVVVGRIAPLLEMEL